MESQPRQNFHVESEAGINRQINMELYASYTYQSMVSRFVHNHQAVTDVQISVRLFHLVSVWIK